MVSEKTTVMCWKGETASAFRKVSQQAPMCCPSSPGSWRTTPRTSSKVSGNVMKQPTAAGSGVEGMLLFSEVVQCFLCASGWGSTVLPDLYNNLTAQELASSPFYSCANGGSGRVNNWPNAAQSLEPGLPRCRSGFSATAVLRVRDAPCRHRTLS